MIRFIVFAGIGALAYATATGDVTVADYKYAFDSAVDVTATAAELGTDAYFTTYDFVTGVFADETLEQE